LPWPGQCHVFFTEISEGTGNVASDSPPRSRIRGAGAGIVLTAATWVILGELGVPALVGLTVLGDLPWVVLLGAAFGALGLVPVFQALLGLSVVSLFVVSWFPFFDNRMRDMVRSDPLKGRQVDAVVVLAGNLTPDGRIGNEALGRLLAGLELRQSLPARHLVLTSIHRIRRGDTVSSERDQRALVARLDPGAILHVVGPVRNTHDEAVATSGLARQEGWRRIAVVTSPLHTRRACAVFERQGLAVVCRPSDSREYSLNLRRPPEGRLESFRDWLYEVVGTRVYRARGWLPERANRKEASPR
jgi:uncharacterized SAM-binding protein YcdF (DUF218 family)